MTELRTDYKDDVLDTSVNTQRKYQMTTNEDGTVSFTDVTQYIQVGNTFGAADINAMNEVLNHSFANGTVRFDVVDGELYYSVYTEDESEV